MKLMGLLAMIGTLFTAGNVSAQVIKPQDKVLVAYYSKSGNTQEIAEKIKENLSADILVIEPVKAYPEDYRQTTEQAKKEVQEKMTPAIKNAKVDLSQYDVIFVGSPCWWGTIASPVRTFLTANDFKGKTVVPFMTHGGSGLGHSVSDIKSIIPEANVTGAEAFRGSFVSMAGSSVKEWLEGLKNE